jgi:hypothetical protein
LRRLGVARRATLGCCGSEKRSGLLVSRAVSTTPKNRRVREFTYDKCVSHKQRKRLRLERAALALKPAISGEGKGLWRNAKADVGGA